MGSLGFCSLVRKYVTVEPCFFFAFSAFEITNFLNANLYLQKTCRDDTFTAPDLSTPCDDEKRGLEFVATVLNSTLLPSMCLALIFTIFASGYSDAAGRKRKIFVLVAVIGTILRTVSTMLQTLFWHWSPLLGVIANILVADTLGGLLSFFNFIYAHLFDKTPIESRLTRVTLLSVLQTLAVIVGKGCAGYLLRVYGFLISYSVCLVLELLALISAFVFIQEEPSVSMKHENTKLVQVFGFKRVWETFGIILFPKNKPKREMVSIWILQLINLFVYFPFFGTKTLQTFTNDDSFKVLTSNDIILPSQGKWPYFICISDIGFIGTKKNSALTARTSYFLR
jgi:MFS family permease